MTKARKFTIIITYIFGAIQIILPLVFNGYDWFMALISIVLGVIYIVFAVILQRERNPRRKRAYLILLATITVIGIVLGSILEGRLRLPLLAVIYLFILTHDYQISFPVKAKSNRSRKV